MMDYCYDYNKITSIQTQVKIEFLDLPDGISLWITDIEGRVYFFDSDNRDNLCAVLHEAVAISYFI